MLQNAIKKTKTQDTRQSSIFKSYIWWRTWRQSIKCFSKLKNEKKAFNKKWAKAMVQLAKCLPPQDEDLSLISRTHTEISHGGRYSVFGVLRQADLCSSLGTNSLIDKFRVLERLCLKNQGGYCLGNNTWGQHVSTWTFTHVQSPPPTYSHILGKALYRISVDPFFCRKCANYQ